MCEREPERYSEQYLFYGKPRGRQRRRQWYEYEVSDGTESVYVLYPTFKELTVSLFFTFQNFMEKLAAVPGGETGSSVWVPKLFTCADGATVLPYIILGSPDFSGQACSLVVVHDFFDTLESTLVFLKPLSTAFAGCQVREY